MGHGKRPVKQGVNLMLQARAGLIPASDWIVAEKCARERRTARLARLVDVYRRLDYVDSENVAIATVLSDLRHCCDSRGLSFEKLDTLAEALYFEEIDVERTLG